MSMLVSRYSSRRVRASLAVLVVLALSASGAAHADPPAPATGADAYRYVTQYAGLGLHRTGTAGNVTTVDWLANELQSIGLQTSTQTFAFNSYSPTHAELRVGATSPAVFPLYYSGTTGPGGITAQLVNVGLGTPIDYALHPVAGKIALIEVPMPLPGLVPTLGTALKGAADGGAVGVVAAIDGSLNAISSPDVDARGGLCTLPTLLVGNNDGAVLRNLAGQSATLTLDATYSTQGHVDNVIATLPGTGNGVIVIGTPITGWFTAATERGTGIGAMLTLARYFAAQAHQHPLAQTIMFVGTSGHEVGFLGLDELVRANPALVPRITAYLHFGASVATKGFIALGNTVVPTGIAEATRILTASENPLLAGLAVTAAVSDGVLPVVAAPQGVGASGEEVSMYTAGVPVVALKSTFAWMHTPRDLPDTTSAALLDPVVRMYRDLTNQILAQDPALIHQANVAAAAIAQVASSAALALGVISCKAYR